MAQGIKVEKTDSGFILYTPASIDCWLLSGQRLCRCDKRGEPQEVGCAPLLRFSPFEIPFPYLPPGSFHVGRFYGISAFCPTRGGSVW